MNKTRYGLPVDVWEAVLDEARHILVNCAKKRQTLTYGELSRQIKTASIHYHGFRMVGLLDEIDGGGFAKESSSLATLVVRQSNGLPGGGYFKHRFSDDAPIDALRAYWQSEFEQTCADWQDACC